MTHSFHPPGPPSWQAPATLLRFGRGPLEFITDFKQRYGDLAYAWVGTEAFYLVSHPDLIEEVLLKKARSFHKDKYTQNLKMLLGEGLVTSEDEHWKRQRKIAAPPLRRKNIAHYAQHMTHYTEALLDRWQPGEVVDLLSEMNRLTLQIVAKALFGVEVEEGFDEVSEALEYCLAFFGDQERTLWRFVPTWLPTRRQRTFNTSAQYINTFFFNLIEERRGAREDDKDDLLSILLSAVDDEGSGMTNTELRDEGVTMLLAGHETTSLALTYTFHFLDLHPEIEARLLEEIDEVLGGRTPTLDDLSAFRYADAVVREAMRLLPPVWAIGREATEPVELDGHTVAPRSQVLVSMWIVHRDPRWYADPLKFWPERWLDGSLEDNPRYTYLPFGGGSRICIGNHFAMMEIVLALCTLLTRYRLERVGDSDFGLLPNVTLRPDRALPFKVVARG